MADAVLSPIVTEILNKLGAAALQEIQSVCNLKTDYGNMEKTISTVKAVLLDAEQQHATNNQVTDWLEKLKDVVDDADELREDFSTEDLRRKVMTLNKKAKKVHIFFSRSNQLFFRLKMSHKIKAIRERLDAIAQTNIKFHVSTVERPLDMQVPINKREDSHSFVRAEQVIGRDGDKKAIVEFLMDSNIQENVSVLAIVGIGGLGKTALAQLVHNDEKITKHFELKLWVCVSDVFDVKQVAEKIIESDTSSKPENLSMNEVQNKLRGIIDGKKYLLVLDDVWIENRDKWLGLGNLLMGGARGSRILVTTRTNLVASAVGAHRQHSLRGLSNEESWTLFKQMAFGKEEEPENKLIVAIGKEILEKCVGVPLAIRTLGSLLCYKDTEEEWLVFKDKDMTKIAQDDNGILPILKLSYDHLPTYLKQCFAFCASYPKDHEIYIHELIQLWIAHGFIQSSDDNQNLEDAGDLYFMDFVRRSFFQVVERDDISNITCKMHDLIHDLAQLVAGDETSIVDLDGKGVSPRTRHMSFDSSIHIDLSWKIPTPLLGAIKMRTFFSPSTESMNLKKSVWETIVRTFKRLRVLDMHESGLEKVPSCISELKHLRYLDLSRNYEIERLPNSITKLQNLQTLKLTLCSSLKELPRDIRKLVSLRHLMVNRCNALTHMPRGLGQLTSLRMLPVFTVGPSNGLSELKDLNNLREELVIRLSSEQPCNLIRATWKEAKEANLKGKKYLKRLKLEFGNNDDDDYNGETSEESVLEGLWPHENLKKLIIEGYGGVRLSTWMSLLPNLVHIELSGCKGCKSVPKMEQLPSLETLCLCNFTSIEYIDDNYSCGGTGTGTGGGNEDDYESLISPSFPSSSSSRVGGRVRQGPTFFPSMKYLTLSGMPNLKGWWRSKAAAAEDKEHSTANNQEEPQLLLPSFPCLVQSQINHCPKLTSMPLQPTVVELCLSNVSEKLVQQQLSLVPLSNLDELSIENMEDLVTLPEEAFQCLTSLRKLEISLCQRLTSLSRGMRHLTTLQSLKIRNCKELDLSHGDDNCMYFQGLTNLTSLHIGYIPKMESLPAWLQHATTLQSLDIIACENLTSLPEWIGNLASLQRLFIYTCNLKSLPEGMCLLTALQRLEIIDCSFSIYVGYQQRVWPKIAHVPHVVIEGRHV